MRHILLIAMCLAFALVGRLPVNAFDVITAPETVNAVNLTGVIDIVQGEAGKVQLSTVLLLEDASSKGLVDGRLQLEAFKAKANRAFTQRLPVSVPGEVLNRAAKVYALIQVGF